MAQIEFRGFAGIALRAEARGAPEDPAVLLLHGAGETRAAWDEVAEALMLAGRYVIALDLRGHGASDWPADGRYDLDAFVEDVRAVLAQLQVRPAVIGASLGGWVAAVALGRDPAQLASGLVLVDVPPQFGAETARAMGDSLRARAARTRQPEFDPRLLDTFDLAAVPARLAEAAPRLTIPVAFVRGGRSPLTEPDAAADFVARIPGAEFAEVEDAGHLVAADRAEALSAVLLDFLERRIPRLAPEYREGSDPRTLRDALGCFATGVTIVTMVDGSGAKVGLTANSFTSVSLDPPLLLVCIARTASAFAACEGAGQFAVNVLHIGQQPASNRFAKRDPDRWELTPWQPGIEGVPVLEGALANFECTRHAVHDGGDHIILVGRVVRARFEPRRDPLLYFRGKYRRLHFD